jgi:acyl-CoA reductase-like NAD-dependent aldehyde dehydrogenase
VAVLRDLAESDALIRPQVTSIIDGEPVAWAGGGEPVPVIDPTDESVISELREADAAEVDRAVASARHAFDHGPWPRMDTDARNAILYSIFETMSAHADELAQLEVRTIGLKLADAQMHARRAAANFRTFAEVASTLSGQTFSQLRNVQTSVTREPKGVAALIAPWNGPLALASMRVATCIAFGNTCVLKPSEFSPLQIHRMVELFHEAGLPPGVVNLVNGRGHSTGVALTNHPGIDMIGFTGGTDTGRRIMSDAGRNLTPVILELGGKSATIVFAGADRERAMDGALQSIYGGNGQQCLAGSRILVQRSIADGFVEEFAERSARLRIGDPLLPETELGPIANRPHRDRVLGFVDVARQDGARLLTGGRPAEAFDRGYFIEPTAVLVEDNKARVAQEEIFGPFATLQVFDTVDEAIAIANDSVFGLVSYVWSNDLYEVQRCSRDVRAGTVWVNTPMIRELRSPFGGFGESGIGRDGMTSSADFFTELKTTMMPVEPVPLPRLGAS